MNTASINGGGPINGSEVAPEVAATTLDATTPYGDLLWLLELEVGGAVYRWSTEQLVVTTAAGDELVFLEGLGDPQLGYAASAGSGDPTVGLTLDTDVDWALLVARGHRLDDAPARLWRWRRGQPWERARLVFRGRTRAPEYGAAGEALAVSIAREPAAESAVLPPPQAVVDASTWPRSGEGPPAESALGQAYPVVIGCPGYDDVSDSIRPVVPVPIVEVAVDIHAVVHGHVVWIGGGAEHIRALLFLEDEATFESIAAVNAEDRLGRSVQLADVTDAGLKTGTAVYVGFQPSEGGGVVWDGRVVRGAGDVIAWICATLYRGPVDWPRLEAVRAYLNLYLIDTWINDPITAWDWLVGELVPLLPIELREGPAGVYPALVRWDLTAADAVATLEAGRDVVREGPIGLDDVEPANEVTVEYGPISESAARWLHRRTLTALRAPGAPDRPVIRVVRDWDWDVITTDERVLGDARCAESQRRYGPRPLRLQLGAIWDTPTALRIASDVVARQALPRRTARYVGDADLEVRVEVGSAVLLTDAELHLEAVVALVTEVTPTPDGVALDLVLLE